METDIGAQALAGLAGSGPLALVLAVAVYRLWSRLGEVRQEMRTAIKEKDDELRDRLKEKDLVIQAQADWLRSVVGHSLSGSNDGGQ